MDGYKNFDELNEEEIQELTNTSYQLFLDEGIITEKDIEEDRDFATYSQLKEYYSDTMFTNDDFFCNMED